MAIFSISMPRPELAFACGSASISRTFFSKTPRDAARFTEVVVIDGGEWLKGAGQFNLLEQIPEEMWDMLEAMIKAKKNK